MTELPSRVEGLRAQIDTLAEQREWPADLVAKAHAACDNENFEELDRVLARLDALW